MTEKQLQAVYHVQQSVSKIKHALQNLEEVLTSLNQTCDHTYPLGHTAIRPESQKCNICMQEVKKT